MRDPGASSSIRFSRFCSHLIYLILCRRTHAYKRQTGRIAERRMTYATVMVSLALNQPNEARLEMAGQLAERFEADLIGIAAAQFTPPLYFTDGEPAQALIEEGEA